MLLLNVFAFMNTIEIDAETHLLPNRRYPHCPRFPLPWSTKEQYIPVRIANLEPAKTVVGILKRHAESCSTIDKFSGERLRVRSIDEGILPHVGMALGVRHRRHVFL